MLYDTDIQYKDESVASQGNRVVHGVCTKTTPVAMEWRHCHTGKAGLCRNRPKIHHKDTKITKKLKIQSAIYKVCLILCNFCDFVVNFAVFDCVGRCRMAADADLNEAQPKKSFHPIALCCVRRDISPSSQ
jgi:hypothetical protein